MPSNILPHPSIPSGAAGFQLSDLAPDFDVPQALTQQAFRFRGDEPLTLYRAPSVILTNLDRIRAPLRPKPGRNPTASACLYSGLADLESNRDIRALIGHKTALDTGGESADPDKWELVAAWFRKFPVHIPCSLTVPRIDLRCPEEAVNRVRTLSADTGLSHSSIATVAVLSTLVDQHSTHPGQAKKMAAMIRGFFGYVRLLHEVGAVFLVAAQKL